MAYFCVMKLGFIGSGNIAWHLSNALLLEGLKPTYIAGREGSQAEQLAAERDCAYFSNLKELPLVDVIFICVTDDAIEEVIKLLPATKALIVHTSGMVALLASESSPNCGVCWPLQSINKNVALDYKSTPLCIEASNPESLELLNKLAVMISDRVQEVSTNERIHLHLAAVFANNFTNLQYTLAHRICNKYEVDFDLLKPLIAETARKITQSQPYDVQTGPAKRHDVHTIARHIELLNDDPILENIYQQLSYTIELLYPKK
jgi:predicted short-subunit dehydrogenase-like oxidoreductase (DUF2520 family)